MKARLPPLGQTNANFRSPLRKSRLHVHLKNKPPIMGGQSQDGLDGSNPRCKNENLLKKVALDYKSHFTFFQSTFSKILHLIDPTNIGNLAPRGQHYQCPHMSLDPMDSRSTSMAIYQDVKSPRHGRMLLRSGQYVRHQDWKHNSQSGYCGQCAF